MRDGPPRRLTDEEVDDLRNEARQHSMWAKKTLGPLGEDGVAFELSPEDLEDLKAHRRVMEADIAAGRFHPGERRCVTLPSGSRFHLAHPDPGEAPPKPRPWWARLLGRR